MFTTTSTSSSTPQAAEGEGASSSCSSSPAAVVLRVAVGSSNPAKIRAVEQALQRALHRNRNRRGSGGDDNPNGSSSKGIANSNNNNNSNATAAGVQLEIRGFAVPSGVSDQPFGDDETQRGAQHRAQCAYQAYRRGGSGNNNNRAPHLAIGLEGGLEWLSRAGGGGGGGGGNGSNEEEEEEEEEQHPQRDLFCMAWMAVLGKREAVTVDCFASADTNSYSGDRRPVFGLAKTASFPLPDAVAGLVQRGVELGDADDRVFQRVQSKRGSGVVGILTDNLIDRSAYYEHALTLALLPWIRPDLYPDGN